MLLFKQHLPHSDTKSQTRPPVRGVGIVVKPVVSKYGCFTCQLWSRAMLRCQYWGGLWPPAKSSHAGQKARTVFLSLSYWTNVFLSNIMVKVNSVSHACFWVPPRLTENFYGMQLYTIFYIHLIYVGGQGLIVQVRLKPNTGHIWARTKQWTWHWMMTVNKSTNPYTLIIHVLQRK